MADETLNDRLILDEAIPIAHGPKLAFHVQNPAAYECWLADNGWTLEEHAAHIARLLTPRSFE